NVAVAEFESRRTSGVRSGHESIEQNRPPEVIAGERILALLEHGTQKRAMERDQPRLAMDRQVQPRDIAEAGQDLGVPPGYLVLQAVQHARGAKAAASAENRLHLRISERRH